MDRRPRGRGDVLTTRTRMTKELEKAVIAFLEEFTKLLRTVNLEYVKKGRP